MSKLRESIKKTFTEDSTTKDKKELYYVVKDTVITDVILASDPEEAKEIALSHNPYNFEGKQIMDYREYDRRFGNNDIENRKFAVLNGECVATVVADTKEEAEEDFTNKVVSYDEVLTFDEFFDKYGRTPEEDLAKLYIDDTDPSPDVFSTTP